MFVVVVVPLERASACVVPRHAHEHAREVGEGLVAVLGQRPPAPRARARCIQRHWPLWRSQSPRKRSKIRARSSDRASTRRLALVPAAPRAARWRGSRSRPGSPRRPPDAGCGYSSIVPGLPPKVSRNSPSAGSSGMKTTVGTRVGHARGLRQRRDDERAAGMAGRSSGPGRCVAGNESLHSGAGSWWGPCRGCGRCSCGRPLPSGRGRCSAWSPPSARE